MEAVQSHQDSRENQIVDGRVAAIILIVAGVFLGKHIGFEFALVIGGILSTIVLYFENPKIKGGIVKFFLTMQLWIVIVIGLIRFLPSFLENFIPSFWAFFLSFLILSNISYVMPLPIERKKYPFWQWTLGSLIFCALFAYTISNAKP